MDRPVAPQLSPANPELETMIEIGKVLTSSLDLQEVLNALMEKHQPEGGWAPVTEAMAAGQRDTRKSRLKARSRALLITEIQGALGVGQRSIALQH